MNQFFPPPDGSRPGPASPDLVEALPSAAREVEEFVAATGWDQPARLFALVPTARLLDGRPELADQVDTGAPLTSVAQEGLPEGELDEALAAIEWPDTVAGCALAQEIFVLPPGAERETTELPDGPTRARQLAAQHPERREARLVAAVLRNGPGACVLRLRGRSGDEVDELVENPDLAPNLLAALQATLE